MGTVTWRWHDDGRFHHPQRGRGAVREQRVRGENQQVVIFDDRPGIACLLSPELTRQLRPFADVDQPAGHFVSS